MNKIKLYEVVDIRNGQYHSIVVTREKNAKWFVPASEIEGED